ncbi:lipopolysaccharide assembly protein LapA domain-containing protein [bacterium BMS3Abin03]|nr:lipopolysaccharide assembly protein LapA domain-containing protein [bacterium BMS3Abin03]MCG6960859.1 lipopolysaccharide assembly protein LapA domain-containing protein [bacterium BMS3Abin03]
MDIKTKLVIIIILLIFTVVIVLQNTNPVKFKLLFWDFQASLIILLLLVFLIGVIIGFIIPKLFKKKKVLEQS